MFLSRDPSIPHTSEVHRKGSISLVPIITVLCATILSGGAPKYHSGEIDRISSNSDIDSVQIFPVVYPSILERRLPNHESSRMYLGSYGDFLSSLCRDLNLDLEVMMRLIQRESGGNASATSVKGAQGMMQIRGIVLDDMRDGIKKYGAFFASIANRTLKKMSNIADRDKIAHLKKISAAIIQGMGSGDKSALPGLMDTYNNLIFTLKMELHNPEINVILGSIYMKHLDTLANKDLDDRSDAVVQVLDKLNRQDIHQINKYRLADKRNRISLDYDFSVLDMSEIITLSMYNVGPNAKNIKMGVLYAIAILA